MREAIYIAWDTNALLMATELGLYVWTSTYHERDHEFYRAKDNDLWLWGY